MKDKWIRTIIHAIVPIMIVLSSLGTPRAINTSVRAQSAVLDYQINIPNLIDKPFMPTVFWFGQVDPFNNYADVRLWYYEDHIQVVFHVIDRLHWQDPSHQLTDITDWDSISLFIDTDGDLSNPLDSNTYRFEAQLGGLNAAYRGSGGSWQYNTIPFDIDTTWRGDQGPNSGVDGKGWQIDYHIPFTSFGLSSPPTEGAQWGIAFIMHDRDDISSSTIQHTYWPEIMNPNQSSTWAKLRFGVPGYYKPQQMSAKIYNIRNGLNNMVVKDAHIGGHTICGEQVDHWSEWGDANYAGYSQINIQNQWDISDWPCFSKYYITFPLDSIPPNEPIYSATFSMNLFGNAGGGEWGDPPDSYIIASIVGEDWEEETISWNNAPLPVENISGAWVYPSQDQEWHLYSWDVSRAVDDALKNGKPLRLALYSIDGEYHSGKYFLSSDWDNLDARPTLRVVTSTPCNSNGTGCFSSHIPMIVK